MKKIKYNPVNEEVRNDFKKGKAFKESDSRIIIDRLLRKAGWQIEDKNQVLTEESAHNTTSGV